MAYARRGEWLDLANATAWLAVALLLAGDVRGRETAARRALKAGLYALLLALAVGFGLSGEALDFWDAALWLACFFAVELNLLRAAPDPAPARGPPPRP